MSLSDNNQADIIDSFNTTSGHLDDILTINNVYFDNMVSQIYPSEFHLNKANTPDTNATFPDLLLTTRSTSYGVYISQLIHFARASSNIADVITHNKLLTQKLLKQGY